MTCVIYNTAPYLQKIEKINKILEEYERNIMDYTRTVLYLSNGDTINMNCFKGNLAHLLGVNLEYLNSANLFNSYMESYDRLKYFVDNFFQFQRMVTEKKLMKYENMFSDYADDKIEIFLDNIKIRTDDMLYVVKYDNEKTYKFENKADVCDYYIVRHIKNAYCVLGLVKNDKGEIYVPATSRKFNTEQELEEFIKRIAIKQEITYPYIMRVRNTKTEYKLEINTRLIERQKFLERVIEKAKEFDATAAVARDYSYSLGILTDEKNAKYKTLSLLRLLTDNFKNGDILDIETINELCGDIELSNEIKALIDACNDKSCITSELNHETYSQISEERTKLKEELKIAKEEILKKEQENKYLIEQNTKLSIENDKCREQVDIFEEAYQKVKKIQENS